MSIFGTLQTAVSGMAAQSNRISSIGQNIANSGTTGYKDSDTQFETLVGNEGANAFHSSGVNTVIRYNTSSQGELSSTSQVTNLAIKGNGFFVVQDSSGATVLTRAGDFVPDSTGNLVNTAGDTLMGYNLSDGSYDVKSGTGILKPVNVNAKFLTATASTAGTLTVNLPSQATAVDTTTVDTPSDNTATSTYTAKGSITTYDSLGKPVIVDIYMTKTNANEWEVTAFNAATAASGGGFPYGTAGSAPLASDTFTFDPTSGSLDANSPTALSVAIPGGNTIKIDLSKTTQLATGYAVSTETADGNAPSKVSSTTIDSDGTLSAIYASGTISATFKIPLATVLSPDNLTVLNGNNYRINSNSGQMTLGTASAGGLGDIDSNSLESSTVDLATELTNLIATQSAYQANSKVLTTGSNMLTTLIQAIPT